MEILVCVKRVPDTSENEIEFNSAGNDIERDDLVYLVNEWDNYAVEEAFRSLTKSAVTSLSSPWETTMTRRYCAERWQWAPRMAC